MPTYEYACTSCHHEWEFEQSIKADAITECPACHQGTAKRQISRSGGFILKGSGWYADLYSSSSNKPASGDKASSGDGDKASSGGDKASGGGDKASSGGDAPAAAKKDEGSKPSGSGGTSGSSEGGSGGTSSGSSGSTPAPSTSSTKSSSAAV